MSPAGARGRRVALALATVVLGWSAVADAAPAEPAAALPPLAASTTFDAVRAIATAEAPPLTDLPLEGKGCAAADGLHPCQLPLAVVQEIVAQAAARENLPADFLLRLIRRESAFDPFAVSRAGAQGIAQFMPATASARSLANPFDPAQAIPQSARYVHELEEQFGNLGLAAAAYNAGPKRIADWLAGQAGLPAETADYVLALTGRPARDWVPASMQAHLLSPATVAAAAAVARARRPRGASARPARLSERSLCAALKGSCIVAGAY
ncbi:MAG TPA: transglycosylase SLT domain-containing protein [Hyphomicrobiales bacterium]|nr:transglycosylase SLT domain-containing protein [Hyphomicrobiales bacterium]